MRKKPTFNYYSSLLEESYTNPELTAWVAAGTTAGHTLPSAEVLTALDALLGTALETGTVASRMKTGYIFHAGSKDMAKLNLKDPATFPLTEVNTVTFSEGNGCKSASSSYFNQPFKTNQYAGIQSDLTCVQYVSESSTTAANMSTHGFRTTVGRFFALRVRGSSTNAAVLNYDIGNGFANANHKGLYVHRHDGTNTIIYKDGNKISAAQANAVPSDVLNRFILARNNNGVADEFYTINLSVDFLFDGFSDADELAFRTAFNTYKTATSLP